MAVAATVLLLAAVLGYVLVFAGSKPRAEAAETIARAGERLREASNLPDLGMVQGLRTNATSALEEARAHFDQGRWDDARRSAIHSENLSQKALDLAKGDDGGQRVRFYRVEGDVRVKRSGEFSWEAADGKMVLQIGDQVKTSASASAQIIYFDGTTTTIQPGSLIEIRELYEDPATRVRKVREKLNWGEVLASVQKKNTDGSFHEVVTEQMAARISEPGEVRVAFDRDKGVASVDVFQGRAELSSAARRETLGAGERIRSGADGQMSRKETILPAPRLVAPSDQRVFVYDDPAKETTTLAWESVPRAARYHLMIADRPLFTDPLYDDAGRKEPSVLIEAIAPADYYWRVSAIDGTGVSGPFSGARRFRVTSQRIRDKGDTTPPALEITEFVQTGAVVIINGRTEPGASLWVDNDKIDVTEDGTFYAVVRLRKEGENILTFMAQDAAGNAAQTKRKAYVETF